jgi:acyl-CoA thioesterase
LPRAPDRPYDGGAMSDPTDTFLRAIDLQPLGEGRYRTEIPDGWQQGKGAFGGLVMAALVRAIEREEPDPARRLRALTGEIPAPVLPGPVEIRTEALRRGAGVTTTRAVLTQRGEVLAQATGVLGSARRGVPGWRTLAAPVMTPWRAVEPIPYVAGVMPTFTAHLEMRSVGPAPFSGEEAPRAEGWVRPRAPMGERGAAYLAGLVDVWWPCALVRFDAPRPSATITYTLELVGDFDGLDPDDPLYYRARRPSPRTGTRWSFASSGGATGASSRSTSRPS